MQNMTETASEGTLYRTYSATCTGIDVVRVTVEVSITPGIGLFLVGLPDNAVRESLLRVTTAMQRNGYAVPGRKTVVNMAPADIKKEGSGYDAAIAVAMLAASGQIFFPEPEGCLIMGELSLDGRLRKVRGILPIAVQAAEMGYDRVIVPRESVHEASWAEGVRIFGVSDLQQLAWSWAEEKLLRRSRCTAGSTGRPGGLSDVISRMWPASRLPEEAWR